MALLVTCFHASLGTRVWISGKHWRRERQTGGSLGSLDSQPTVICKLWVQKRPRSKKQSGKWLRKSPLSTSGLYICVPTHMNGPTHMHMPTHMHTLTHMNMHTNLYMHIQYKQKSTCLWILHTLLDLLLLTYQSLNFLRQLTKHNLPFWNQIN